MPISEAEQADLDALKANKNIEILHRWELLRSYVRASPEELKCSGHKSVGDALTYTVNNGIKEIEKLTKAFLKKWPDK